MLSSGLSAGLFLGPEDEDDGCHQAEESGDVVPVELLSREEEHRHDGEDGQCDDLLDYLELKKGKGTAVLGVADLVGRNHEAILYQSNPPRDENDNIKWPVLRNTGSLQLQMTIPRDGHEDVGDDQKQNGYDRSFHVCLRCQVGG